MRLPPAQLILTHGVVLSSRTAVTEFYKELHRRRLWEKFPISPEIAVILTVTNRKSQQWRREGGEGGRRPRRHFAGAAFGASIAMC